MSRNTQVEFNKRVSDKNIKTLIIGSQMFEKRLETQNPRRKRNLIKIKSCLIYRQL